MDRIDISSPIDAGEIEKLTVGTLVLISGIIYTARDAAHHRLIQALDNNETLPFDIKGQTVYYTGPTPARPGQVIGSAGPTTSGRMDAYTPRLLAEGLRAMIGKGERSAAVREAVQQYRAVYFIAIGGAGALLSRSIKKVEVIAYDDLGTEAIRRLTVERFPAIVADDVYGADIFEQGKASYRREAR